MRTLISKSAPPSYMCFTVGGSCRCPIRCPAYWPEAGSGADTCPVLRPNQCFLLEFQQLRKGVLGFDHEVAEELHTHNQEKVMSHVDGHRSQGGELCDGGQGLSLDWRWLEMPISLSLLLTSHFLWCLWRQGLLELSNSRLKAEQNAVGIHSRKVTWEKVPLFYCWGKVSRASMWKLPLLPEHSLGLSAGR